MSIDKDQEEWGGEGKVHQELSELDQRRDEGLSSKMRAGSVRVCSPPFEPRGLLKMKSSVASAVGASSSSVLSGCCSAGTGV